MDDHTALLLAVLAKPGFQHLSTRQLAGKLNLFRGHGIGCRRWVLVIRQAEAEGLIRYDSSLDVELA